MLLRLLRLLHEGCVEHGGGAADQGEIEPLTAGKRRYLHGSQTWNCHEGAFMIPQSS